MRAAANFYISSVLNIVSVGFIVIGVGVVCVVCVVGVIAVVVVGIAFLRKEVGSSLQVNASTSQYQLAAYENRTGEHIFTTKTK